MEEVIIDNKQTHDLAVSIYAADILSYIQAHQAEYGVFIASERPNDGYGDGMNDELSILRWLYKVL